MVFDSYFVARGSNELGLFAQAAGLDNEEIAFWTKAIVFRKKESGRSDWSREDHCVQIKLATLLRISTFSQSPEFGIVFPDFDVSVAYFDRWFCLEEVDCVDLATTDWLTGRLPIIVGRTGREPVDRWLSACQL